ncbi:hypothetical protein Aglo01_43450 [Actinokineospora globicatena]|nr:hypothetical protein Aglo01_43450 [Actinokineospora globicatena]
MSNRHGPKRSCPVQDGGERTRPARGQVQHYDDRGGEVRGESGGKTRQRLNTTRGGAHDD